MSLASVVDSSRYYKNKWCSNNASNERVGLLRRNSIFLPNFVFLFSERIFALWRFGNSDCQCYAMVALNPVVLANVRRQGQEQQLKQEKSFSISHLSLFIYQCLCP